MTRITTSEPITIGGDGIKVEVDATYFYMIERAVWSAQDCLSDPKRAYGILETIKEDARRRYAIARKDDPNLPPFWRKYLDNEVISGRQPAGTAHSGIVVSTSP